MKQAKPFLFTALAGIAAAAFSGCSPAQSQPVVTNLPASPTAFTNKNMENFQKPPPAELKQKLTAMQFDVTQHASTEPAFHNEFWDNHKPGLYVDIVSGKPLFSSLDKFDSGCGWPSFSSAIESKEVIEKHDSTYGMEHT